MRAAFIQDEMCDKRLMSTIIYLMKYFMSVPTKNSILLSSLTLTNYYTIIIIIHSCTLIYPTAPIVVSYQINNNNSNSGINNCGLQFLFQSG